MTDGVRRPVPSTPGLKGLQVQDDLLVLTDVEDVETVEDLSCGRWIAAEKCIPAGRAE